jgi:acetylornithine/succinyldiaminopimelate/putrescine aminotransferase
VIASQLLVKEKRDLLQRNMRRDKMMDRMKIMREIMRKVKRRMMVEKERGMGMMMERAMEKEMTMEMGMILKRLNGLKIIEKERKRSNEWLGLGETSTKISRLQDPLICCKTDF